jgi:hypothetical protein
MELFDHIKAVRHSPYGPDYSPYLMNTHKPLPADLSGLLCRAVVDYEEDGTIIIALTYFQIKKVTPKGNWIHTYSSTSRQRFVLTGTGKCFARPTEKEALADLLYRQEFRIERLSVALKTASHVVKAISEGLVVGL